MVSVDAFLHTQLVCTGNVVGPKSIVEPGGGVDLHIGHPGQPMIVAGECLGCKMAPFVRKACLIRAADEAPCEISIYGQEKDNSTAGLARMNLVLHNKGAGVIVGNKSTLSAPQFKDENNPELLKTFNYIVVNPPFSDKSWMDGITVPDSYGRYSEAVLGLPPEKNGDYAWLLHVLKSLKSTGKAAVILPHGVLFRGNVVKIFSRRENHDNKDSQK